MSLDERYFEIIYVTGFILDVQPTFNIQTFIYTNKNFYVINVVWTNKHTETIISAKIGNQKF